MKVRLDLELTGVAWIVYSLNEIVQGRLNIHMLSF